jgi:hypothetical protein
MTYIFEGSDTGLLFLSKLLARYFAREDCKDHALLS